MAGTAISREDVKARLAQIGEADILVGIPSYNNARSIGHVVRAVQAGLAKYFPDRKTVLVNSDGGSTDGTMDVVHETTIDDFRSILLSHRVESFSKIAIPYHGIPGKGSAFRTIFEIARALNVKACAVVDSDLRSITPEWIELLVKPVMDDGYDYVAPLYHRHKYDGTITNSIVYPLTRALYGKNVRQPIGGDFGFSGRLGRFYLSKDVWETDVARYGIDIWMTTTAIANDFRVCQAFLGAKIHDAKDPGADLSAMLYQVVGATFDLMEEYPDTWKKVTTAEAVPVFGFTYEVGLEPVSVNIQRMIDKFTLGTRELGALWENVLSPDTLDFLRQLADEPGNGFHIPDTVWVDIIYSFALAAHGSVLNKEHLLKSLTPLYIGRTASFVIEARESSGPEVEKKIENLCGAYEKLKPFLSDRWK
ncbi:MAG: Glycosyl transferase family 2 [Syntrophorhabdus sp. PtaB.Bin047]|nr:MAG: Glycosyl transferase family 2 [Syntrophorhabdus sp. PtaB.Bin047]